MDLTLRKRLPFVLALTFFPLAFARPAQRAVRVGICPRSKPCRVRRKESPDYGWHARIARSRRAWQAQ